MFIFSSFNTLFWKKNKQNIFSNTFSHHLLLEILYCSLMSIIKFDQLSSKSTFYFQHSVQKKKLFKNGVSQT
jgi:hypothetical protein